MKRNSLKWTIRCITILLVTWCLMSLVFSQIVLKRKVVINVVGESGAKITGTLTVDGRTTDITRDLPAEFEYRAKHVLIEATLSNAQSKGRISGSLYVNDRQLGSVGAPAGQGVRLGFKAPGLLGQGGSKSWISSFIAHDLAVK